jgi:hypothetical protein
MAADQRPANDLVAIQKPGSVPLGSQPINAIRVVFSFLPAGRDYTHSLEPN